MHRIAYALWPVLAAAMAFPSSAQQAKGGAAAAPVVTPEIKTALDRMANALKAIDTMQITADLTSEEVLDDGQKIQSSGVLTIVSRRPDRLYVEVASERQARQLFYDGSQVTVYGPKTGYYATVKAPATTYLVIGELKRRYDLEAPLADLFEWGASGVKLDKVTSAFYAGPDRIEGQVCDHYAFRQPDVDWQLWIRRDGQAVPCKVVMVNTADTSQPQTTAVFNWNTGQAIADARFQFTPPADAHRIELTQVSAANQGGR